MSRWEAGSLPQTIERQDASRFEGRAGHFAYDPPAAGCVDWHLNFADADLFCAYGSALFAQDEMQVAEHPALGSLRRALLARGESTLTTEYGRPTPILVTGVERRCSIATDPNDDEGRPAGLYGNAFSRASAEAVRRATTVLDPPTTTHLLAIEAPACGSGVYDVDEIVHVLVTATTGFAAVVRETARLFPGHEAVVHTGYWGCGAYGGNRELMSLLQLIAASAAGLTSLVFHYGDAATPFEAAVSRLDELLPRGAKKATNDLVDAIDSLAFEWGIGDGN